MNKIEKALNKARKESNGFQAEKVRPLHDPLTSGDGPAQTGKEVVERAGTRSFQPRPEVLERHRIIKRVSDQKVQDSYHLLRARILQLAARESWRTIMVTSAVHGEGKTTTAINLGLSIARDSKASALLVDANLRSPKVHEYLDLNARPGLSEYLRKERSLAGLLVNPDTDKFTVMPSGAPLQDPTDVLGSERMNRLLQDLKRQDSSRYILLDCPHVIDMPETLMLCGFVDAVLFVVEADSTPKGDVQQAFSILEEDRLLGVIMNKLASR